MRRANWDWSRQREEDNAMSHQMGREDGFFGQHTNRSYAPSQSWYDHGFNETFQPDTDKKW